MNDIAQLSPAAQVAAIIAFAVVAGLFVIGIFGGFRRGE
jgi:hypothetical protein